MIECNLRFCVRHKYDEEYSGSPHKHPCYELVFYLNGVGCGHFRNTTYNFKKDEFVVLPPKTTHVEKGEKGVEVLYIGFDILNSDVGQISGLFKDKNYNILEFMEKIYYETTHWSKNSMALAQKYTEIIILKLLNSEDNDTSSNGIDNSIKNILEYISNNYMDNINAKNLAQMAGYSYDYFRKLFYRNVGESVNSYITRTRIGIATDMLRTQKYKLNEIASSCGFKSSSHLCVLYKKYTGETPFGMIASQNKDSILKDKFDK